MPLVYRRLLGLLFATCVLVGAGFATYRIEAHGDGLARIRAGQSATEALAAARESLHGLLRTLESRVSTGASLSPVRALVAQRVDSATLQDAFTNEPWWSLFREEFSLHVLATGLNRFAYAPRGSVLSADLTALLPVDAQRPVVSGLVLAGGAPHLAASALVDVPLPGSADRARLLLARPVTVADLEELSRSSRTALGLADAKGKLLARVGRPPLDEADLSGLLAGDNLEPRVDEAGGWAVTRAEAAPGLYLWTAMDTRAEAQRAREPNQAVLLPIWIAALLTAGAALLLALRSPREAATRELLARTNARLAAAEAQIKRLTTSMPAVRPPNAPAPAQPRVTAQRPALQRSRSEPTLEAPQPFGRYELLRPIGQGGMARLYLAIARSTGGFERLFVIKRLHEPLAHQQPMVALFMDEARLGASLIHSNIVPIYDFGEVDGEFYIASEYILGRDLDVLVRRSVTQDGRALDMGTVFYLGHQALEALGYAHTRADTRGRPLGIVHRDVSPMNILASARGEVKLFDFGIAKSADRSTHTKVGLVKGNVNFMAPEQARGQAVDSRADLFTMGLTLYWCLTGELLYEGPTDYELLVKAAAGPGAAEWERLSRLPPTAAALLYRALQPSPADRFQTAEEFSRALPPESTAGTAALARTMLRLLGDELRTEAAFRARATGRPLPGDNAGTG
ncbi:serine/threonine-protein kinase [Myxococcaceae bacterium GXIMD 01537]